MLINLFEYIVYKLNIVKLFNFFIFFGYGIFQYVFNINEIIMLNLQFIILLNIVKLLMRYTYMYMIWIIVMKVCLNICNRFGCDLFIGYIQFDFCYIDSCFIILVSRCFLFLISCCFIILVSSQLISINLVEGWNQFYFKKIRY